MPQRKMSKAAKAVAYDKLKQELDLYHLYFWDTTTGSSINGKALRVGEPFAVTLAGVDREDGDPYRATVYRPLGGCPYVVVKYEDRRQVTHAEILYLEDFRPGEHAPLPLRILAERVHATWARVLKGEG